MTVTAPTGYASYFADAAAAIAKARRAAVADRYPIESLAVEWREFSQLKSIANEWRALAARALVPNVFYEPAFARAAAPVFGGHVGAALVWSSGPRPRLLGLFPAGVEVRRYGIRLPVLVGWTHPYAPFGTPLIEREAAEPVLAALLTYLAGNADLPGLLLLPFVPEEGSFAAALSAALRRLQAPCAAFNRHTRALLAPNNDRSAYVERALGARKYRELRRSIRRLSEVGSVSFAAATAPTAILSAMTDFLALEAGGWKGKSGTAAACNDDIRAFVEAAVMGLAAEHKVAIDRILLDGRAVAAAITLRSGDGAWFWKIAYDEAAARYAPGVILTALVTEQLAEDRTIARADSCATPDHAVMNRTWSERLALCDLLIAVRPHTSFARAQRLETLRRGLIGAAKAVCERIRR